MIIEVHYDIEKEFIKILDSIPNKFSFYDFTHIFKRNDSSDNEEKTSIIKRSIEDFRGKDACIIDVSDMSSLNSFVFEEINFFIEMLSEIGIKKLIINYPTNLLISVLKKRSDVTFLDPYKFKKINMDCLNGLKYDVENNIIGQEKSKSIIYRKLIVQKIRNNDKPLVFMFYGSPGIGKTEMAKQISKSLFGTDNIIREQMSMTNDSYSVEYFKSTRHSENSFSKTLINRESNLLLLDEFALAPNNIQTSFFQLFDEGYFVDQNYKVNMNNSIIICTSNYTSKSQIRRELSGALVSRFDALIPFYDFNEDEKLKIASKIINDYKYESIDSDCISDLSNEQFRKKLVKQSNFREIRNFIEDDISYKIMKKYMK